MASTKARDLLCGCGVDLAVDADHTAEGRDRIGLKRAAIGIDDGRAGRGSAGIRVLDDDDGGGVELADQLPAGVEVDDVVVAQLLALQLAGVGHAFATAVGVECSVLVRIFSVPQGLQEGVDDANRCRQLLLREDGLPLGSSMLSSAVAIPAS